jgi:hypothetical protein
MVDEKECKLVLTLLSEEENIPVKLLDRTTSVEGYHYLLSSEENPAVKPDYIKGVITNAMSIIHEDEKGRIKYVPTKIELTYPLIQKEIYEEPSQPVAKPAAKGSDDFTDDIPF